MVIQVVKLFNYVFFVYLKAWPLPPAPLATAGFFVAGLGAWQYSDRFGYGWLVGFLLFGVCFAGSLYCYVRKFLDASFHVICLELVVASPLVSLQLLATVHCHRFDGLLRCCFFCCLGEMCAGSLASGCLFSKNLYVRNRKL